jgi:hypothetical protein
MYYVCTFLVTPLGVFFPNFKSRCLYVRLYRNFNFDGWDTPLTHWYHTAHSNRTQCSQSHHLTRCKARLLSLSHTPPCENRFRRRVHFMWRIKIVSNEFMRAVKKYHTKSKTLLHMSCLWLGFVTEWPHRSPNFSPLNLRRYARCYS